MFLAADWLQAVATGDAVTVGQAWQQVRLGDVRPDVDSLNTLLKCAPADQMIATV